MSQTSAPGFFELLDRLVASTVPSIERPRGSDHPRIPGAVYPVDYGEIPGTVAGDGAGVDVFVGTAPGLGLVGVVLTCDLAKRDVETKLLLGTTDEEVRAVLAFLRTTLALGGHWVPRRP